MGPEGAAALRRGEGSGQPAEERCLRGHRRAGRACVAWAGRGWGRARVCREERRLRGRPGAGLGAAAVGAGARGRRGPR